MPIQLTDILGLIKKRARLLVALVILSVAFVLLLVLLGPLRIYTNKGTETSPMEFAQARERWETRTFSKYRLTASYWSNSPGLKVECRQEVDVQDERVVSVLSNECPLYWTLSITDIFDLFERFVGTHPTQRSPSGPCGFYVVDAVYDELLGYPLHMETREFQGIPERDRYLTYHTPQCWQSDLPSYRVIVETLQPMP